MNDKKQLANAEINAAMKELIEALKDMRFTPEKDEELMLRLIVQGAMQRAWRRGAEDMRREAGQAILEIVLT